MHTLDIHRLDYHIPASSLFEEIVDLPMPVWLDSGFPSANHSRFDILSAHPEETLLASELAEHSDKSSLLERFINRSKSILSKIKKVQYSEAIPFKGGIIGYLGYDLGSEAYETKTPDETKTSEKAYFGLYLWAFIYDHHSQTAMLVFHPDCDKKIKLKVLSLVGKFTKDIAKKSTEHQYKNSHERSFQLNSKFLPTESRNTYEKNLTAINQYILSGDVYQVNYAQHFSAEYIGMPSEAYLTQRASHPAPYSAFIGFKEQSILCHSPEQFLDIQGRDVVTHPIKGTAPRANDSKVDKVNADSLQASTKDRAENLMIVDLLRNDLGKSCQTGSISVPKLFELQSFSNVHHLVSQIKGRISAHKEALDLIQDCHPGGSITGAPKIRAMEIIEELESAPRGVYCGSIGFISCCGQANMNIAIRTMFADGERLHCWGGGGIVADSDVEKEYQETLFKVGPMMRSMERDFLEVPL